MSSFGLAGLLFCVAGLVAAFSGHAEVMAMFSAVGVLMLAISR